VSRIWSGFASGGTAPDGRGEQFFNYVFIEAEEDAANKPVVVWYNGGPGAASMFGLLVELGPYLLNEASLGEAYNQTGVPQMVYNPFGWTQVANVIAVNNPPPIGFSYCAAPGPSGDGYSCGDWDDALVAAANHEFLTNMFTTEFPEYAKNELYITGESCTSHVGTSCVDVVCGYGWAAVVVVVGGARARGSEKERWGHYARICRASVRLRVLVNPSHTPLRLANRLRLLPPLFFARISLPPFSQMQASTSPQSLGPSSRRPVRLTSKVSRWGTGAWGWTYSAGAATRIRALGTFYVKVVVLHV
jgi:hypothetical protein